MVEGVLADHVVADDKTVQVERYLKLSQFYHRLILNVLLMEE